MRPASPNERERIRRARARLERRRVAVTVEAVALEAALPVSKVAVVLERRALP